VTTKAAPIRAGLRGGVAAQWLPQKRFTCERYGDNAAAGEDHFDFAGLYVIRTVGFAPTRRNGFWVPSSVAFCAGFMSRASFAPVLHPLTNAFERSAHPIAPARFLSLACASSRRGRGGRNEHAQLLHLERTGVVIVRPVSDRSHAIS
jgi:hypothetical protein